MERPEGVERNYGFTPRTRYEPVNCLPRRSTHMATRTTPPSTPVLRLVGLALCFLLALLAAGCQVDEQPATTSAFPTAMPSPELADAAIYAAVIRQLAGPDDTFGGKLAKSTLYIVRRTNDAAGDPGSGASPPVILPDVIQAEVTTLLADLPSRVVWVGCIRRCSSRARQRPCRQRGRDHSAWQPAI